MNLEDTSVQKVNERFKMFLFKGKKKLWFVFIAS